MFRRGIGKRKVERKYRSEWLLRMNGKDQNENEGFEGGKILRVEDR